MLNVSRSNTIVQNATKQEEFWRGKNHTKLLFFCCCDCSVGKFSFKSVIWGCLKAQITVNKRPDYKVITGKIGGKLTCAPQTERDNVKLDMKEHQR